VYPDFLFHRRFQIQVGLFKKIMDDIVGFNGYFLQKRNAAGRLGFSPSQKVTLALRMMAYGCSADSIDEYAHMSNSFLRILTLIQNKT
jgi:hypothetical protein